MNKVPDIISSKDLSYISDAFEWNFTLAKKSYDNANSVTDSKISKELSKTYEMHNNICAELLKILEEGN